MFDVSTLGLAVDTNSVKAASKDLTQFVAAGDKAAGSGTKMEASWSKVRNVLTGLALGATVVELVKMADQTSLLDARLRNVAGSQKAFSELQASAYTIAQRNNTGLAETVQLMTKLHDPVTRLGGSTKETTAIVDAFATSLRVGGASTQEAAAATLQFAQAMASGRLQGDEFRSLAEASPRFMKALAEGMNQPIENLKKMGSEGKLTADIVGNALISQLTKLREEGKKLPDTVGGSLTRLRNDFLVTINDINKQSGATLGIAGAIDEARKLLPSLKAEAIEVASSIGAWFERNREVMGETWQAVVGLVSSLWDAAKAVGALVAGVADLAVGTGAVATVLQTARLLIAGFLDGVELIGASFAHVGSAILQFLVTPMLRSAEIAESITRLFDEGTADKIRANIASVRDFVEAGERYAEGVTRNFADGKTHVAALGEELAKNNAKLGKVGKTATATGTSFRTLKSNTKEASDEMEAMQKAVDSLKASLRVHIAELQAEEAAGESLNEAQKGLIKFREELTDKYKLASPETRKAIQDMFDQWDALLKVKAATEANAKLQDEVYQARLKEYEAAQQSTDALYSLVEQQKAENMSLAYTKDQLRAVELKRLDDAIATTKQAIAKDALNSVSTAETMKLYDTLDALTKLRAARGEEVHLRMARESAEAWAQTARTIREELTSALEDAFAAGEDFFDSLAKSIEKALKAAAFRYVATSTTDFIFSSLGLPTQQRGASGSGGLGSLLSGSNLNNTGISLGNVDITSNQLLQGAGYLDAFMSARAGKWGQAMGTAIGTYLMPGAGTLIGRTLGSVADKVFAGSSGTPHMGGYVDYNIGTGAFRDITAAQGGRQDPQAQQTVSALSATLGGILKSGLEAFGKEASGTVRAVFEADGKDAAWGIFQVLDQAGQVTAGFGAQGTFAADPAQGFAEFSDQAAMAIKDALLQADVPAWAEGVLSEISGADSLKAAIDAIAQTVENISVFRASLESLGPTFEMLRGASDSTVVALADATGGFDGLQSALSSYIQNFYDEGERTQMTLDGIAAELDKFNVALPSTREGFRELFETVDPDTQRDLYAALLKVSKAFAGVVPAAEKAAGALSSAASSIGSLSVPTPSSLSPVGPYSGHQVRQGVLDPATVAQFASKPFIQEKAQQYAADFLARTGHAIPGLTLEGYTNTLAVNNLSIDLRNRRGRGGSPRDDPAIAASKQLAEEMKQLRLTLSDYLDSLLTGSDSALSPEEQYKTAAKAFAEVQGTTDVELLKSRSQAFLSASKTYQGLSGYSGDFFAVVDALKKTNELLQGIRSDGNENAITTADGARELASTMRGLRNDSKTGQEASNLQARLAYQQKAE